MTAIAVSFKRKKVAQLNLSYDIPEPTSLSLGRLGVQVAEAEEDLLADFAYFLSSFPAGKIFIDLNRLSLADEQKQAIAYEDLISILRAFPEGWTYQANNPPTPAQPDDSAEKMYQQFGAIVY